MTDIYIAYRREDHDKAERLAGALEASGFSVFWDKKVSGGEGWRAKLEQELSDAKCVVVLWSEGSVGPEGEFVQDEAERARERGVLLPVLIEKVRPPVGFGGRQALDLHSWKGDLVDKSFMSLQSAAQAIVAGGPPESQFSNARRIRIATYAATGIALFSSIVGFSNNVASVQGPVCKVPVIHGCLCRTFGLGGVPTKKEETIWQAAIRREDGDGLRGYLSRYPNGVFSTEAQARLAGCRIADVESWSPDVRNQPLIVATATRSSASEAAARADALVRAKDEAKFVCGGYAQGEFRLTGAEAKADTWRCSARGGGWTCGFDGQAVCKVSVRRADRKETCRPGA